MHVEELIVLYSAVGDCAAAVHKEKQVAKQRRAKRVKPTYHYPALVLLVFSTTNAAWRLQSNS